MAKSCIASGLQFADNRLVDVDVDRDFAHAVDDIVEIVGQPHAVGDVEAHDERVVEQFMDVVDDGIAAVLVIDDPREVQASGFPEMGGARQRGIRELQKQLGEAVVLRCAEKSADGAPDCSHLPPLDKPGRSPGISRPSACAADISWPTG